MASNFDTEDRDAPVCPHCGHTETDAWELDFGTVVEGDTEMCCASCGKAMFVSRHVTVSYTTAPVRAEWDSLVADAARASEEFGDDECERFAAELRGGA